MQSSGQINWRWVPQLILIYFASVLVLNKNESLADDNGTCLWREKIFLGRVPIKEQHKLVQLTPDASSGHSEVSRSVVHDSIKVIGASDITSVFNCDLDTNRRFNLRQSNFDAKKMQIRAVTQAVHVPQPRPARGSCVFWGQLSVPIISLTPHVKCWKAGNLHYRELLKTVLANLRPGEENAFSVGFSFFATDEAPRHRHKLIDDLFHP